MTGQDLITTAILGMEGFLRNNVLFEDTDDALTFISNVSSDEHKYQILDYVPAKSQSEVLDYLCNHVRPEHAVDREILNSILSKFEAETLTRIFYSNQLLVFINDSKWAKEKFSETLSSENSEELLNDLKDKVVDATYYDHLYEDRYQRAMNHKRQAVITIDTDSVFCNVNSHMEVISKLLSLDASNKQQQTLLVNIFISITTEALKRLFWTLTTNMGLLESAKPIINMKQEFLYSRILLTENKKNYSGLITAELGKLLQTPALDIKGLPILKKTSVPKLLRKQFTDLVRNDILGTDKINLKKIIGMYDSIEASLETSLRSGSADYLIPKNVELIETYKIPDQQDSVRAVIAWNALEPENQIVPPTKINMIKLKPELFEALSNEKSIKDLKEYAAVHEEGNETFPNEIIKLARNYPKKLDVIAKTIYNVGVSTVKLDISRFGFSVIAVPKEDEKVPEYLLDFIDYKSMVNTNMQPSYILLSSLGVYCTDIKLTKYKSNIIPI